MNETPFFGPSVWGTVAVTPTLGTGLVAIYTTGSQINTVPIPALLLQTRVTGAVGITQTRVVAADFDGNELVPIDDAIGVAVQGTDDYDNLIAEAQDRVDNWTRAQAEQAMSP
jgi:hypothetical protein